MKSSNSVRIAGDKTVDDWKAFRSTLAVGGTPDLWRKAFQDYFHARLYYRYLKPIEVLQTSDKFRGEGFSILAVQCTLIEFLESTLEGRNYRHRRRADQPLSPHEYSKSGELFIAFLTTRQPFAKEFNDRLAEDFYVSVRCGLLHEARTKCDWIIRARSETGILVSDSQKILYRDNFQDALLNFITWYGSELPIDIGLQRAFIRKFDSLCQ